MKNLMEENQRLLKLVLQTSEKTRKYILYGRVISIVYLILILAPIVIAAIFLPPFLKSTIGPYQELLSNTTTGQTGFSPGVLNNVQEFLDEYNQQQN